MALLFMLLFLLMSPCYHTFVTVSSTTFILDQTPFYVNGFNAYWMPYLALENRNMITKFLKEAKEIGMNVARTWAFNDGGYNAMQTFLGEYNEQALQGLDFVVAEASKNGIKLILCFVNNYKDLGGRPQYVKWAQALGINATSDEDFYTDETIKHFYKKYVEMILTRNNTVTGVAYKDDPAIFSWELINEPRSTDSSGDTLQSWISEIAAFVKSIDNNHMLEIGLEGFYSANNPGIISPGSWSEALGTDFIRNHLIPDIDFATVHIYPDIWMPDMPFESHVSFVSDWIETHVHDAAEKVKKPVLFSEFGKLGKSEDGKREILLSTVYSSIYSSAGGLVWQLFAEEMDPVWNDGFEIVVSKDVSVTSIIYAHSLRTGLLKSPLNLIEKKHISRTKILMNITD